MIIDAFEFSRKAENASGSIAIADLNRIDVAEKSGRLEWRLQGSTDEGARPFFHLEVSGPVQLTCQRCLQPVRIEVNVDARILVAGNDAEADLHPLDEDGYDVIVGSHHFDVGHLVEDEVILGLPGVPKHAHCPTLIDAKGLDLGARSSASPFAALETLKKTSRS